MKSYCLLLLALLGLSIPYQAQTTFDFQVIIDPVTVPSVVGLQSYAFGQSDGKWLILGGRRDGLHARQPFNAFPASNNNTTIYVIDPDSQQLWSASVNTLPTAIAEQMQSTNMNFYQDADTLYIIGGYAFSESADDHITFDKLTTVQVSGSLTLLLTVPLLTSFSSRHQTPFLPIQARSWEKLALLFTSLAGIVLTGVTTR